MRLEHLLQSKNVDECLSALIEAPFGFITNVPIRFYIKKCFIYRKKPGISTSIKT